MKLLIHFSFALFAITHAYGQSNDLQRHYTEAMEAYKAGNYDQFYTSITKAHEIHPYHQGILYQAGIAAALTDRKKEALDYLKSAILIQSDFPLAIKDLKSLEGMAEFEALKKIKAESAVAIITSDTAFVIDDRTLHLEGLSPGAEKGVFYAGSIRKRKIVQIRNGEIADFTSSAADGLCSVFGVKTDERENVLWASSSPMEQMEKYTATIPSAVYKYDLKTGNLLHTYLPENPALQLVLGDLTLTGKGEVYASDSKNNLIFKVNPGSGKLEQFYSSDEFWNLQGITASDDGEYLFIADYVRGIFRLDLKRMALTQLTSTLDVSLKAIDGLTFYKNSLIAIQNYIYPMRVTRYFLNDRQDALTSFTILDRAHPAFNEPTLGTISDGYFYYIANSQWSGYDDSGAQKPASGLQDIVILKAKLE